MTFQEITTVASCASGRPLDRRPARISAGLSYMSAVEVPAAFPQEGGQGTLDAPRPACPCPELSWALAPRVHHQPPQRRPRSHLRLQRRRLRGYVLGDPRRARRGRLALQRGRHTSRRLPKLALGPGAARGQLAHQQRRRGGVRRGDERQRQGIGHEEPRHAADLQVLVVDAGLAGRRGARRAGEVLVEVRGLPHRLRQRHAWITEVLLVTSQRGREAPVDLRQVLEVAVHERREVRLRQDLRPRGRQQDAAPGLGVEQHGLDAKDNGIP
eukprot:SRR837773.19808.p1 GENE.SRR837773.19808~~SRR837773.19808.p1  ORF type:complete len:270 (+),score=48.03 SRR837773.19808:481-1290(+)